MSFLAPIASILSIVGFVGGTALDIMGKKQEADAYTAYANYQAKIAARNRDAMRANAQNAIQEAQQKQAELDNEHAAFEGEQIAAQSASGVSLGSGSFVQTRAVARSLRNQDAIRIRDEGEVARAAYMMNAREAEDARKYAKKEAKNAQSAGWIGIGASLLGGASRLGNHWAYSQSPSGMSVPAGNGGSGW